MGGKLEAVDHVELEAPLGTADELRWFYGEVAGLEAHPPSGEDDNIIRFRSEQLELRIRLCAAPRLEQVARRLTIRVPSMIEAAEMLSDKGVPFGWTSGLSTTDRELVLLDPGGNRVALRRDWPFAPL